MAKKKKRRTASSKDAIDVIVLAACDGVSRAPGGGKATLYGIFDTFFLSDLKQAVSFFVYAKVKGSGKHKLKLDLLDKDDKSAWSEAAPEMEVDLRPGGAQIQVQTIAQFGKAGPYRVVVKSGRKTLAEYPINVVKK